MERHLTRLVAVLVAVALTASHDGLAQSLAGQVGRGARTASAMTLLPGDVLRIDVWQQKEYSCECPISADGTISHPLYRELNVSGLGLADIETRLRALLGKYLATPTFDLQPLVRVVVAGEVRQPMIYTVPPGTSVAQVIFRAGGPSDRGRLDQVKLVRGQSVRTLDLTRPDAAPMDVDVHSGDQILVGRRRSVMQDIVAPSSSILAALAAVTGVIIQLNRR
jgi:protein involved in polysaccharide export with SLBB domain